MSSSRGFTLIELLIVIAIVAVLAVTVILTLNPAELLKQARDSIRASDLNTLNKALALVETEVANAPFGSTSTVYVSIPDVSTACANLGLPALPPGYAYACVTSANLRKVDGTGWIPVNFTAISSGSPLSQLPTDPTNTTSSQRYYTYNPGGSWEITALIESAKYRSIATNDGDAFPGVLSVGTTHGTTPGIRDAGLIGYWRFDDGTGTTTIDSSGGNHPGILTNGPTWQTAASCIQDGCLSFDGTNDWVTMGDVNEVEGLDQITVMAWARPLDLTSEKAVVSKFGSSWMLEPVGGGLRFYNPGKSTAVGGTVALNQWNHLVGSYDGAFSRTYVNGALGGQIAGSGTMAAGVSALQVGVYSSGSYPWNGLIDEVRIYNRALSLAEIQAIYSNP